MARVHRTRVGESVQAGRRRWRAGVRALFAVAASLLIPGLASGQVLSGSYTGDGSDNRAVTQLGFQPDVVIIKGNTTQIGVIRTSDMTGDSAKPMTGATALTANLVQSLDPTGFTIGSDARVNSNGVEYYWIAFKEGSKRLTAGTYTGNGLISQAMTGVGFSPEFVVIMSAGAAETVWRLSADTESFTFANSSGGPWITALGADGFTVNNDGRVNTLSTTYYYVAWNEVDGVMDVGTYTGDASDARAVASTTFKPEYVLVKRDGNSDAVHHPASLGQSTDSSLFFTATAAGADRIQALAADGFELGTSDEVNRNAQTYNFVAWRRIVVQTEILSGSYVGDGTDNRAITGLGFTPDLVMIKGDSTDNGVLRSYTMSGDATKDMIDGTLSANRIQSLDSSGFTVGTDSRVNSIGVTYHWVAWVAGAGGMTIGTYAGNGTAGRNITDVGFSPDFVIVSGPSAEAVYRNSAGSTSHSFDAAANNAWISATGTDGFTVGSDARVNASGSSYTFAAWNAVPGKMVVGSYSGDPNDDRDVTGVGFQPEYVFVQRSATGYNAIHHARSLGAATDSSLFFDNRGAFANYIQALQPDGFEVGQEANINASGGTFVYAAWAASTLTAVRMASMKATRTGSGVTVAWRTGYEVDNLGFEVHRETSGERTRVTTGPIAGSALFVPPGIAMTAGRAYTWIDDAPAALESGVRYWIEDIDLNGKRTLHGPIVPGAKASLTKETERKPSDPMPPRDGAPPMQSEGAAPLEPVTTNSPLLEELREPQPGSNEALTPSDTQAPAPAPQMLRYGAPLYLAGVGTPISVPMPLPWRRPVTPPRRTTRISPSVQSQPNDAAAVSSRTTPAIPTALAAPSLSTTSVAAGEPIVSGQTSQPAIASTSPASNVAMTSAGPSSTSAGTTSQSSIIVSQSLVPAAPSRLRFRARPFVTSISGAPAAEPAAEVRQQWTIAAQAGARVMVRAAGLYRFTYAQLVAAGISPSANPANLRLVVDGIERPMIVNDSDGQFNHGDTVEFYATGVDTPSTDTRAYWITTGSAAALRLPLVDARVAGSPAGASFAYTVERKDREIFFGALQNGDEENFFGPLIMEGPPTTQELLLTDVAPVATEAHLEVALQGVTELPGEDDHRVGVLVNGAEAGEIVFDGRAAVVASLTIPHASLTTGANTIAFEARGGSDDMSLVDYVRLIYQREYRADANQLTLSAEGGQELTVAGFTNDAIRVFDVTGDVASQELLGTVTADGGEWSIRFTVPASGERKLFMTTGDVLGSANIHPNVPTALHGAGQAGEIVMIADGTFVNALAPLRSLRESQGFSVQLVDVQDVYDEFSYGEKTPAAIRSFLMRAAGSWAKPPRFVLLVGNATTDPRNYQGLNEPDLVPTRIVSTDVLETASDDWFADSDGDSFADLATVGRLPARTAAEVAVMVDKIVGYEQSTASEHWHRSVLLVSDDGRNDAGEGNADAFAVSNGQLAAIVRSDFEVQHVQRHQDPTAAETLRTRLAEGTFLLNYQGHGSVDVWRGDLLTTADVPALDNGSRLPFIVAMTCFAGFFHGLYPEESLAESLLRASNGGAIAVWASSGMTDASWQASMDRELFRQIFGGNWRSIGDAVRAAKKAVGNADVRRTWILFGDPALRLKGLSQPPVDSTPSVAPVSAPPDPPAAEPTVQELEGRNRRPAHVAARLADYDGDRRDDALLADAQTGSWLSLLGQPGSFSYTPGQFSVAGEPIALSLNDDGRTDLFVYNPQTGAWLQATSAGDGRFVTSTGNWPAGLEVVAGDLDGNGRDDLFAHHADGSWVQAFADGDGDYRYRYGSGLQQGHAYAADFNGDGRADVFLYDASTGRWTMAFSTNDDPPVLVQGTWTAGWQPVVASLNGDAAADLVLWHAHSGTWVQCVRGTSEFFAYRSGSFAAGGRLHAIDLNGDGRDELLRYDWRTGEWTMALLNASGTVQQFDGLWETGWELTPGDLNGDARQDLLLYDPDTGQWLRRVNLVTGWMDDAGGVWARDWTVAGHRH